MHTQLNIQNGITITQKMYLIDLNDFMKFLSCMYYMYNTINIA